MAISCEVRRLITVVTPSAFNLTNAALSGCPLIVRSPVTATTPRNPVASICLGIGNSFWASTDTGIKRLRMAFNMLATMACSFPLFDSHMRRPSMMKYRATKYNRDSEDGWWTHG